MGRRCAVAALWLLAAAPGGLAVAAAPDPAAIASLSATASPTPLPLAAPAPPALPRAVRPVAPPRRRAAAAPPAPQGRGGTVRGALRRALLAGHLRQGEHDRLRRQWRDAERLARRLPGRRAAELRAVLAAIADLAARGRLTPGRLPVAFLTVRRNAFAWSERPLPAVRQRTTFARDPLIWQYYPGRGWQLQALATAGRANALGGVCARERARGRPAQHGPRCRPAALGRILDRLVEMSVRRGSFRAWEAMYGFGGARPGWISGMTQATAIQALVRGAAALERPELRDVARSALRAFERRPPVGVAAPAGGGGRFYLLYSDLPQLKVLNGHLQALIGLREAAQRGLSVRAGRAFRAGQRAARRAVPASDTGAWSLYSTGGRESDLGYHRLVGGFLRDLCDATGRGLYCGAGKRFARYEREPPRVQVAPLPRLRAGRPARLAFRLSKVAVVRVTVASRRTGAALDVQTRLGRGTHAFGFRPPGKGTYRVRVRAAALSGPVASTARDVVVRPLRRPRKAGAKARRGPRRAAARP
ncbi:MAG TPA: D-glucuronyl C5-epimerase family protein [Baekduia sp.]|nr:D-glucuronyl C5-epimerase family protein [Baekduia sp.]